MNANPVSEASLTAANPFSAGDVEAILRERGWLSAEVTPEMESWLRDAAAMLGTQAMANSSSSSIAREALQDFFSLIFSYDARALLDNVNNQTVMAREGARDVIRELANRVLFFPEPGDTGVDSRRYEEIIDSLKASLNCRGRELFHPIRLALAGRAGEGGLDRVILLLDRAASLGFALPVKGTRRRMIEFCAALR